MIAGVTTAAQYAQLGQPRNPDETPPDFSKVRLQYITMLMNQIKTQKMLVTQHPLY